MRNMLLCLVSVLVFHAGVAQSDLTWDDFADVSFKPQLVEEYGVEFLMPTFGQHIQSYNGKEISITGYFLNLSGSGDIFLVSQYPMASCFFCGTAGPETIIEIQFNEEPSFDTDQIVTVKGTLELNSLDVNQCNYILKDASGELVK